MDRIHRREYAQIAMLCDKHNAVQNKAACRSAPKHGTCKMSCGKGAKNNDGGSKTCTDKTPCPQQNRGVVCDTSRKNEGKLLNRLDKPTFIDGNLISVCPQKKPYKEPTHLAQKHSPWNDLHQRYTLSSSRHEVYHYDPQAPRDNLDFVLKSQYDQHGEFLRGTNETLVQPETLGLDHKRVLKNRVYHEPPSPKPMNHPLRIAEGKRKDLTHSLKNAIDGHHTQTTNRGYARKLDGGFFTS